MQVYKQKVKHLLYEHQNNITTLKADGELAIKLQQDEFRKREGDLGKDKRNLKNELKEQVGAGEKLWSVPSCGPVICLPLATHALCNTKVNKKYTLTHLTFVKCSLAW